MKRFLITGAVTLVCIAILYYSGFIDAFISGFEGHGILPSCSRGQSDAKRVFENSPLAKSSNVTVVAIVDAQTISASPKKVECKATVILNNGQKGIMNYSFTDDPSLGGTVDI